MALHEYEIEINGLPHTVQLDEEGAKALGLKTSDAKSATAPKAASKGRAPRKPAGERKARTPRNKAAKPAANKAASAVDPAVAAATDPDASE